MPPRSLSHYELGDLLGRGGMGEVYRARDTRLDRDVAIKILPASLAADPDLRQRFEREARTISSLNHPNICTLHDIGEEGDTRFLVMELVEGLSLAQRLKDKPLPLRDVFVYGAQIADALDRAHRAGVVHRDLKPGNVMLAASGAKLMDFGLARVEVAGAADGATVIDSPATAQPLTQEGALVGTFQYMAPEQLEGGTADHRSDLWAFGCVLYEMATGMRAFEGKTQASVIGSILHHEPAPITERSELAPPELDRIVRACLAKDPDRRLQSAHDVKLQLEWLRDGASSSSSIGPLPALPKKRRSVLPTVVTAAIAAAIGAAIAVGGFGRDAGSTDGFVTRPLLTDLGRYDLNPTMTPVIGPDARAVFLALREGSVRSIVRRDFDRLTLDPIEGTDGGSAPFLSPDGRWLGFVDVAGVRKVPIDGGVSQVVTSLPAVNAADWAADGWIYLSVEAGGAEGTTALYRVRDTGGVAEPFGQLDAERDEANAWLPEVLPGGQTVLATTVGQQNAIVAFGADGTRRVLVEDAFLARFVAPDFLLYQDEATQALAVVRFDPEAVEVRSGPVIITQPMDGGFEFDVAADDVLVYVPAPVESQGLYLTWFDGDGKQTRASDMRASWAQPRISPDGRRVLVRRTGADCELWMYDRDRDSFSRVVQNGDTHDPVWAPDGRQIVFRREDGAENVLMQLAGTRTVTVLGEGARRGTPWSWSTGGNLLALAVPAENGRGDIWLRAMDDSPGDAVPYMTTSFDETAPALSPDGKWIAFASDETGSQQVIVRAVPDDGRAWPVSTRGGTSPVWSRDGSRLHFVSEDTGALMVVAVDTDEGVRIGRPEVLLEDGINRSRIGNYDVGPDGSIVTVLSPEGTTLPEVRVLTNWKRVVAERRGTGE